MFNVQCVSVAVPEPGTGTRVTGRVDEFRTGVGSTKLACEPLLSKATFHGNVKNHTVNVNSCV